MSTPANLTQLIADLQALIAAQNDIQPYSVQMLAHAQQATGAGGGGGGGMTEAEFIDAVDSASVRYAAYQALLGALTGAQANAATLASDPTTSAAIVALLKAILLQISTVDYNVGAGGGSNLSIRDEIFTANQGLGNLGTKTWFYGAGTQSTDQEYAVAWDNFPGSTLSPLWGETGNSGGGTYVVNLNTFTLTSNTASGAYQYAKTPAVFEPRGGRLSLRVAASFGGGVGTPPLETSCIKYFGFGSGDPPIPLALSGTSKIPMAISMR